MKILIIHNLHRKGSSSGDDQVFFNEVDLLRKNGHSVVTYTTINDVFDSSSFIKKVFLSFGMIWSFKHYKNIRKLVKKEHPDIAHVHTFFPLLSPSIFYALKKEKIKVIATLHDTRLICPCATSLRNNNICNKCIDGKYFRICKYKCFKGSFKQSFWISIIFKFHRFLKTFYKKIDKYICLNNDQINLLINAKYDQSKIVKKYNFCLDYYIDKYESITNLELPDRFVVFYGRIGEEKGISVLMKIWEEIDDINIVVLGSGPMANELNKWAKNKANVYYLGYKPHDICQMIVKKSSFVIFPSIWYEGCSMVILESESIGKPIVASDIGFLTEAIINGYNGYRVKLKSISDFKEKIYFLWNNENLVKNMSENCRKDYLEKYSPENNYNQLMKIYNETIKE